MISESALAKFRASLRSQSFCSGEQGYDDARSVPNAMIARAAYGPNYDRLVALKNKYDPTNLFRMNHNIRPSI